MAAQNVYYEFTTSLKLIEQITLNWIHPCEISKHADNTLDKNERSVQLSNSKMGT